jgi:hypothetical protein
MADDKKEPWLNYLALTTVILAVCATLSTARGGSYSTRSVLSQAQAANQWAYYQAKSLKSYLYEIQKQEIDTEIAANAGRWPEATTALYRGLSADYGAQVARYTAEKDTIQAQARRLEAVRDDAQLHARVFSEAIIYLQIGILMSSVSALLRKKPLWILGSAAGVVGLYHFVMGLVGKG